MWHPKTVSSWLETSATPAERRDFDDLYNSISKYRGVGSALNRSSTYQARRPSPVNTAARRRTRSPRRRAPEQSFNKSFTKSFNKSLGNSLRRTRSKSPRHVKWQCAVCAARNTGSLNACEFCGAVRRKRAPVTFSEEDYDSLEHDDGNKHSLWYSSSEDDQRSRYSRRTSRSRSARSRRRSPGKRRRSPKKWRSTRRRSDTDEDAFYISSDSASTIRPRRVLEFDSGSYDVRSRSWKGARPSTARSRRARSPRRRSPRPRWKYDVSDGDDDEGYGAPHGAYRPPIWRSSARSPRKRSPGAKGRSRTRTMSPRRSRTPKARRATSRRSPRSPHYY